MPLQVLHIAKQLSTLIACQLHILMHCLNVLIQSRQPGKFLVTAVTWVHCGYSPKPRSRLVNPGSMQPELRGTISVTKQEYQHLDMNLCINANFEHFVSIWRYSPVAARIVKNQTDHKLFSPPPKKKIVQSAMQEASYCTLCHCRQTAQLALGWITTKS